MHIFLVPMTYHVPTPAILGHTTHYHVLIHAKQLSCKKGCGLSEKEVKSKGGSQEIAAMMLMPIKFRGVAKTQAQVRASILFKYQD